MSKETIVCHSERSLQSEKSLPPSTGMSFLFLSSAGTDMISYQGVETR